MIPVFLPGLCTIVTYLDYNIGWFFLIIRSESVSPFRNILSADMMDLSTLTATKGFLKASQI